MTQNQALTGRVNAALDKRALAHLRDSLAETGEAAVASIRKAADVVVYSDTIEAVIARAREVAAESDGDVQAQAEEIAAGLARRRDDARARLAQARS